MGKYYSETFHRGHANCVVLFQMGNKITTVDTGVLIDVLTHHSNLRADDHKEWAKNIREFIASRHPSQSHVDLVPDQLSDVAVIILTLLCVILTMALLYANKQHRALERQLHNLETMNVTESTFIKHKLLGLQMDDLRKGDSRRSRRELSRDEV